MKKILIIDDKNKSQTNKHSTQELIEKLTIPQKELVDFMESADGLWEFEDYNQDKISKINLDLENYEYIFIHQSYDNPLLNDPKLLIDLLPERISLVLFSGKRSEQLSFKDNQKSESARYDFPVEIHGKHYEIRRSVYYENFPAFLNSKLEENSYNIEYLYKPTREVKKKKLEVLLLTIKEKLEDSNEMAVNDPSFIDFFKLLRYTQEEIVSIKKIYLTKNYNYFVELLENEISNFK